MPDKQIPTDLNWVDERTKCKPCEVFKQLQYEVEKDVEVRKASVTADQKKEDCIGFRFKVQGQDSFIVWRNGAGIVSSVEFRLENQAIVVRDSKHQIILTASLTFNDQGRCMLVVDKVELERWQMRRRALEDLFFGF